MTIASEPSAHFRRTVYQCNGLLFCPCTTQRSSLSHENGMESYYLKKIQSESRMGQGGCMSNLVVTQTSPLKYIIRQASLSASPRQTPCNIFPDTSVLGRIISLISLLKHHLAMQRNHSAQNHNELCATHWKNRCVLHWGRPIRQYLSTLLKSLLLSFPTVRRRERYRSHA